MQSIPITNLGYTRLDDRQSTFGNTEFFECAPDIILLPPSVPQKYGAVLIGLTSTGDINGPLIMKVGEVWNFGYHLHRSQLFPGGVPIGYEGLLWDCWFLARRTDFNLLVAGVA